MLRCLIVLAAASFVGAAIGQGAGPFDSVDCRQALAGLQAREAVVGAERRGGAASAASAPDAALLGLRRQASRVCLGGGAASAPPALRAARAPVVVPPVAVGRSALPPAPSVGPVLKPVEPNLMVTSCDASGCWASDGSRLQRAGSLLLGPRGLCSVQGSLLHCP